MAALDTCLQVLTASNRSSDNNVIVIVIDFNSKKYIYFVNFVKFVCKLSAGVKFPHTINSPDIFTTNEQVVANFLVTS